MSAYTRIVCICFNLYKKCSIRGCIKDHWSSPAISNQDQTTKNRQASWSNDKKQVCLLVIRCIWECVFIKFSSFPRYTVLLFFTSYNPRASLKPWRLSLITLFSAVTSPDSLSKAEPANKLNPNLSPSDNGLQHPLSLNRPGSCFFNPCPSSPTPIQAFQFLEELVSKFSRVRDWQYSLHCWEGIGVSSEGDSGHSNRRKTEKNQNRGQA